MCGGESFVDDLNMERGTVSGRVALLLRSAEVKPFVAKICSTFVELFFLLSCRKFRAGLLKLAFVFEHACYFLWQH